MDGSRWLEPFSTLVEPDGSLTPERVVGEQRLGDIRAFYEAVPVDMEDRLVYRVYSMPVPEVGSELQTCTTVLEPGTVGREYFMTKGHFHAVRDRSEVYLGLSGEGLLLLATEEGEHRVVEMRRGTVAYVPGGWAHRSANTGTAPLVFFAAYIGDAGHDYKTVAEHGFPILAVHGPDGPRVVPNPRYRGPAA
jgi:glucose-6-phosphate isomerase